MSLPQVQAILDAADRRDAARSLQLLETTHAANAPLLAGKDGTSVFEKCSAYLQNLVRPKKKVSLVERMLGGGRR